MLGKLYIVKSGDTLWDIAGQQLGNPSDYDRATHPTT